MVTIKGSANGRDQRQGQFVLSNSLRTLEYVMLPAFRITKTFPKYKERKTELAIR